MRGEDFTYYVVVRNCQHLFSIRALSIFETLAYYLKAMFAIDVSADELSVELPRRAPVSVSYTLLDVLFICILCKCNDDSSFPCHFVDEAMPSCFQKVLEGKNLLLWKNLLVKYDYDDLGVVDFMTKGVPLVGMHDTPQCYPELLRPATMTEEDQCYLAT